MGIFDDYNIDPDEIKESNFDIADGTYRFEISEAEILDGTKNKPDTTFFIIDYQLEDEDGDTAGSTREFFTMAEDGESDTKRVQTSMSFFKTRLRSLGVTDLSSFDGSEIIGLTGVLQLRSTPGKGANKDKMFQNVKSVRLDEQEEAEEAPAPKKAPAKKPAAKPTISKEDAAAKARVKANQAKREAAAEEPEDEDEDNPFGND